MEGFSATHNTFVTISAEATSLHRRGGVFSVAQWAAGRVVLDDAKKKLSMDLFQRVIIG